MVRVPVRIQVSSRPPADPVCLEISAATMKIPEPIIEPTTIMVPSNNPMARTNSCSVLATGVLLTLLDPAIVRLPPSCSEPRTAVILGGAAKIAHLNPKFYC